MLVARPRKLGPTVTFRLPIDMHVLAEQRARLHDMTVAEWIASRITEALGRQAERDANPDTTGAPPGNTLVTTYFKESKKK